MNKKELYINELYEEVLELHRRIATAPRNTNDEKKLRLKIRSKTLTIQRLEAENYTESKL